MVPIAQGQGRGRRTKKACTCSERQCVCTYIHYSYMESWRCIYVCICVHVFIHTHSHTFVLYNVMCFDATLLAVNEQCSRIYYCISVWVHQKCCQCCIRHTAQLLYGAVLYVYYQRYHLLASDHIKGTAHSVLKVRDRNTAWKAVSFAVLPK